MGLRFLGDLIENTVEVWLNKSEITDAVVITKKNGFLDTICRTDFLWFIFNSNDLICIQVKDARKEDFREPIISTETEQMLRKQYGFTGKVYVALFLVTGAHGDHVEFCPMDTPDTIYNKIKTGKVTFVL